MADKSIWDERYAAKELVWSAGPNKRFAEEIASLSPGRALDIACGEGRNAVYLAELGWEVTAVDFSAVGIEKASQIAAKRGVSVNWIVGDVVEMVLPQGFDLVDVLYLHTDPASRDVWLPKAMASVASGGTFIYIGHDPANIDEGVGGPQDPLLLPDSAQICALLGGFEVEFADVTRRPVDHDPGHGAEAGVALDTVVRARRIMAK